MRWGSAIKIHDIRFWKTTGGQEVDFILGDASIAIEAKERCSLAQCLTGKKLKWENIQSIFYRGKYF